MCFMIANEKTPQKRTNGVKVRHCKGYHRPSKIRKNP